MRQGTLIAMPGTNLMLKPITTILMARYYNSKAGVFTSMDPDLGDGDDNVSVSKGE